MCKQKAIEFQCGVFSADFAPMFSLGLLNYNEVAPKARWKKCDGIIHLTGILILYNAAVEGSKTNLIKTYFNISSVLYYWANISVKEQTDQIVKQNLFRLQG